MRRSLRTVSLSWRWLLETGSRGALLVSSSFAALYVGFVIEGEVDASPFFVLPVALCGIAFGLRGGLIMAGASSALVWWGSGLSPAHFGVRVFALAFLGVAVGAFADERRRMIAAAGRRDELSLDLIATASADGR